MATVRLDLVEDTSWVEEFGELVETTVGCVVKMDRVEVPPALGIAAYVLGLAGMWQPSQAIDAAHPNVKVESRVIDKVISLTEDQIAVHVLVTFRLQRPTAAFDLEGGINTVQIKTEVDGAGAQITVTDGTRIQGGTVDVYEAELAKDYETTEATDDPDATALLWVNKTNDAIFRGQPFGTWRVAGVSWKPLDMAASPKTWRFRWQLAHMAGLWNPVCTFVDPEKGEIPDGLVVGTGANAGIKRITWYDTATFADKFT